MPAKDLKRFGEKLRQFRKTAGFYQEELAGKLDLLHAKNDSTAELRVDGNRISKWERAFTDKRGREWQPKRQHLLYLIEIFAGQLTFDKAQQWALQAGYRLSDADLQKIFSAPTAPRAAQLFPLSVSGSNFSRLTMPPERRLFGIGRNRQQLLRLLKKDDAPWLIAINGIGGIGKTSLAGDLVREIMTAGRFYDLVWVSAKQEEFLPGAGIRQLEQPFLQQDSEKSLNVSTLADALLSQLDSAVPFTRSLEEKLVVLTTLLKERSYLIVVDNLETVADYQTLLPFLRRLVKPAKILLTSRYSLRACSDVFCLELTELKQADALTFLRYEAEVRGISTLAQASAAQLENIYKVVGGNPLALKLIIGQLSVLPLSQVLANLRQAQGKRTEALYTYIYWQAWQALIVAGQQTLLTMPLAQGGPFAQLLALTGLDAATLHQALDNLIKRSLIEVSGNIEERRYRIHRLTETFLLTEVIKWQARP